ITVESRESPNGSKNSANTTAETALIIPAVSGIDQLIEQWLDHVYSGNSRSRRTIDAYQERMVDFRQWLGAEGLDLDSEAQDRIAAVARAWASHRRPGSRRAGSEVAQSTFDLRLATISSF